MAFVGKPRNEEQYGRLMGMIQPETTPSKRVGTDAPVGSVAAGPKAGQTAEEFTKAGAAPGGAFKRQLEGANIGGITRLAEQPLLREAGQEATRVAQEGIGYKTGQEKYLSEQPQFQFGEKETPDVIKRLAEGDTGATETAQKILQRTEIPVQEFTTADIKEFTPMQALRGGSVESLLRKEAAGPYSTGMAGLDALLFSKKGGAPALATKGATLRATEQAAADALEKSLTEEARKKASGLVESQKTKLRGGVETGLKGREEAYTKAPEGQQSRLQQAQQALYDDYVNRYKQTQDERTQFINKQISDLRNEALDTLMGRLQQAYYADEEKRARETSGDYTIKSRPKESFRQQALQDSRMADVERELTQFFDPTLRSTAQVQAGAIPRLGFSNVITPEDAAQYNRLQALIGGQALKPETLQITPASYDRAALEGKLQQFKELAMRHAKK